MKTTLEYHGHRRGGVPEKRRWGRLAFLVAVMFGLVFALSGVSSALSDEDMASDVLQAVMADQGVPLDDQAVHDRVQAEVLEAIRVGAITWETLNELGFRWTASESQESAASSTSIPASSFPGDALRERLRERVMEQITLWKAIAADWREAFEQLRERVRECRDDGDVECWRELRLELQYEHARRFQEMFENRYQEMESSGDVAPPLGELERLREQTQDRVQDMIQNSTSEALDQAGLQVQDLEQLQERLQEQAQVHAGSGNDQSGQGGN
ncbi:MAG: hypothetical protein RIS41_2061 [Actinomycetota bacterium]|jgi:hypothetical protein